MSINIQLLKEVVKKQAERKTAVSNKKIQKVAKTKPKSITKRSRQHFKKEPLTNLAAELHGKYGKALTGSPANIIDTQPTHKHFRSI